MSGILNLLLAGAASVIKDAYFNLVTLLLNTTATNGAQNNTFLDSANQAVFTASITTTVMTVSAITSGSISVGTGITGTGVTGGTTVVNQLTGTTGSTGTYTVSASQSVSSTTITATGFPITRNGNTTQGTFTPFSQTGWSGYFDGASDYIQFTNSDFSVSTGDFTAEWFMFITTDKAQVGVMTASSNSNLTIGYGSGSANARQPYVEFGGAGVYIGTMSNYMNTWVHVCVMRSSGTVYTFQNGTLLSSASKSAATGSTANMVVGTNAGDTANQSVPGYLSNVRFATSAIYSTSGFTVPTSPLTRTSQSATNVQFLTLQSNRFLDSNGVNIPASSPLAITRYGDTSVQAFSPFLPTDVYSTTTVGGSGYVGATATYLTVTSQPLINANDWTVEFWMYPTQFNNGGGIFGASNGGGTQPKLYLYVTGANLIIEGYLSPSFFTALSTPVPTLNQWTYVSVSRSSSTGNGYLYYNGVLQGSAASVPAITGITSGFSLFSNGEGSSAGFYGYMGNVRVSNTARYTGSSYSVPTSLSTSDGNTTLLVNAVNAGIFDSAAKKDLETVGTAQVSTTQAKWGTTSMYFAGSGNYLLTPYSPNLVFGTADFTFECQLYWTGGGGENNLIMNNASGGFNVKLSAATSTNWALENAYVGQVADFGTAPTKNTWHHIAITRASGTLYAFIDGTQVYSGANSTDFVNTASWYVAGNGASLSLYITGYIDDLRITKGYARYTASFTPPAAAFPLQ